MSCHVDQRLKKTLTLKANRAPCAMMDLKSHEWIMDGPHATLSWSCRKSLSCFTATTKAQQTGAKFVMQNETCSNHFFSSSLIFAICFQRCSDSSWYTPPKLNMESANHPFEKDNHLNQTSILWSHHRSFFWRATHSEIKSPSFVSSQLVKSDSFKHRASAYKASAVVDPLLLLWSNKYPNLAVFDKEKIPFASAMKRTLQAPSR